MIDKQRSVRNSPSATRGFNRIVMICLVLSLHKIKYYNVHGAQKYENMPGSWISITFL